ncbi:MAG: protein kinase [Candidatus Obscuribacterales bacterium]|nr:protein kinase [Candidatus Obscuribacterales bacterium]
MHKLLRPESLLGQTVADRYKLLEIIGQGGIGVVYKAEHTLMNRLVAIKMLRNESLADERNRQRFQQEAQAISALNHPNIVSVFDFGFTPDNSAFLVMDYLDGKDLDSLIQDSGYLTPEEVVPIFTQICDAMTQTHVHGIIHRDLKPGNIIVLKKDGKSLAKLVDFGMAKFETQSGRQAQSLTQPGEVFGSPYYMSPEQCTGMKLDQRSDIYSMGVLMYEAVTGRPPFLADNMVSMAQMHIYEKPAAIGETINDPEFPQWMQNIIFKALEKNVNDRYQSTDELKQALLAFNKFWLEKTGGETKPISLRQTTTSRHVKDEVLAAIQAAAEKKQSAEKEKPKEESATPLKQNYENSQSGKRKSTGLGKPAVWLLSGTVLGTCVAAALFFAFGKAPESSSKRWQDLDEAGKAALLTGNLSEAEYDFNQAVRLADKNGELDNPSLYSSLIGLASVYQQQGKYEMSENVYKQTLERIEHNESSSSASLAPVLLKLGKLYCSMDRLKEAEQMHKRAMEIVEDAFGKDDPHMADCLTDYAQTKRKLGRPDEAKKMEAEAAKIRSKVMSSGNKKTGNDK